MQLKMVLLAAWLGVCNVAAAQSDSTLQKTKKKSCSCSFSSINQGGILSGERGSYFQFQTINGIRYKSWFAGLGLGWDMYPESGLPIFLDIRKNIIDRLYKLYTPFVYAEGGFHFADMHNEKNEWTETKYTNGLFYDVGLGVRISFNKKNGLLLSGGYSYRKYEKRMSYNYGCDFYPCYGSSETYNYSLNRLSLKVGFQL